jgi:hypothetical protein
VATPVVWPRAGADYPTPGRWPDDNPRLEVLRHIGVVPGV